jgi:hypothetical protein
MTLQKYFSHPSLVIYFFSNPIDKTRTGTANRWETTNIKPLGPIIMIVRPFRNRELSDHHIHYKPLLSQVLGFFCAFYPPQQIVQNRWAKTILLSQINMF